MKTRIIVLVGLVVALSPLGLRLDDSTWRVGSLLMISFIIASGLYVITGLARIVSLAYLSVCGIGAYAAGFCSSNLELPSLFSVVIGVVVATAGAALMGVLTRSLQDHFLTLATLALAEILTNCFRGWTKVTGGANGLNVPPLALGNITLWSPSEYFPVCAFAALGAITLAFRLERAPLGAALRALGDAEHVAESFGIGQQSLRVVVFALSGAFAGLAGALKAHVDGFVGPESFGVVQSVLYLCFIVIGGSGHTWSIFVAGGFAVVVTESLRRLGGWQMVILAVLVICILRWRARARAPVET